jgi:hypothetical protein
VPTKPTQPFGYIAFGKDGTCRKHIETLTNVKSEQEAEIGHRLANALGIMTGKSVSVQSCEENDHDFLLQLGDHQVLVQAVEIVERDYLRKLSEDEFVNGSSAFRSFVCLGRDKMFGVDEQRNREVILDRIKRNLAKRYAKPEMPLWLLIWTVCADFFPFYSEAGHERVSDGVIDARRWLGENSSHPFDAIYFFHPLGRPHRIWPH